MSDQGEPAGKNPSQYTPEELAYQRGLRDANVDAHLRNHDQSIRSHEQRLNAINGSIGRNADNTQRLNELVEEMHRNLSAIVKERDTRDAVEEDRETQTVKAEKRWLDKRTFLLGCVSIAVVLLVGMGTIAVMLVALHK